MATTLSSDAIKLLEDYGRKLVEVAKDCRTIFKVTGPMTATVRVKGDNYKKTPLLGGEEFVLKAVYLGRRKGLIAVFQPLMFTASYEYMEIPIDNCGASLAGWDHFRDVVAMSGEAGDPSVSAVENVQRASGDDYENNERFGSW